MSLNQFFESLEQALATNFLSKDESIVALPANVRAESLERFQKNPSRPRGNLVFHDLDSLLTYAGVHETDGTVILAERPQGGKGAGSVKLILDWHESPADKTPETALPGWGEHKGVFPLRFTEDFTAWTGIAGRQVTQAVLAEFLEEHLHAVVEPDGLMLLEAVSRLSGRRDVSFESARRTDNGDVALVWKEDTVANNGLFPSRFTINIPVYFGAEDETVFELHALLRYRVNEGKLTFEVKFIRIDKLVDLAFSEILDRVRKYAAERFQHTTIYQGSING